MNSLKHLTFLILAVLVSTLATIRPAAAGGGGSGQPGGAGAVAATDE